MLILQCTWSYVMVRCSRWIIIKHVKITFVKVFIKGNFGYCPRAPFLRRETGKVVWIPSKFASIHFSDTLTSDGFSGINKVTKLCPKYLLTRNHKWSSQYQILINRPGEIKQYTKLSSLYRVCGYEYGRYLDCVSNIYS